MPTTRNATLASTKRGGAELLDPTLGSDGDEVDVELSDDVVTTILGLETLARCFGASARVIEPNTQRRQIRGRRRATARSPEAARCGEMNA